VNRERFEDVLDAYVDGELDPATVAEVDAFLLASPACRDALEERRALGKRVRDEAPYFRAPESLRGALRRQLRPVERPPGRRRLLSWPFAGGLAAAGAVAGLVAGIWLGRPPVHAPMFDDVVASHVAALSPGGRLVEVVSTDRHTVKPWFAGRIDIAPLVRDLSVDGFQLVGGRLDRVGEHESAAVVYRIRNHYVDLFMWRAPHDQVEAVRMTQARGFEVATWSSAGVRHTAISDVNRADLERFARLASAP
jgi:anti-sigma factor RsiW